MQKIKFALAAAAAAAVMLPAAAQAQLSFNIGAVSLYKSNGIDQDDRQGTNAKAFRPAIQGGVDYDFGNGFYVGNWNSTGKFGDANVEIDLYAGFSDEISEGLSYDIGYAHYIYPNSGGGWNGGEIYASLTFGVFTAEITRGTSGSIKKHSRLGLSIAQPLTDKLTLEAGVGFRNKSNGNSGAHDYSVGVSYDLGNDLTANVTLSGAQRSKVGDVGKDRLIFGISKSF